MKILLTRDDGVNWLLEMLRAEEGKRGLLWNLMDATALAD